MCVRTSRLSVPFLTIVSLAAFALTGCGSGSACGDKCTPKGPWQSPTTQAVRALLLVNADELEIEFLDDKKSAPLCIGRDDVQEFYLQPGLHTVAATFTYDVPPSEGLLGEVEGHLLTTEHHFQAGHAYVALYREHPYPKPSGDVGAVYSNTHRPHKQYYWTLEFVDLAEASLRNEPEVQKARLYCDWVTEVANASN